MTDQTFIGLSGFAGSGKTTVANALRDELLLLDKTIDVQILSFATPIKAMIREVCFQANVEYDILKKNVQIPEFDASLRDMMQTLGTEWGRKLIKDNLWVDIAFDTARNTSAPYIIFDDCRFANEAMEIRHNGGYLFRLQRKGVDAINGHVSEQPVDGSVLIDNNGSIEETVSKILACFV